MGSIRAVALSLALLLAASTDALAQPASASIALDTFEPTPAGDAFFGVPSPFAVGRVVPRGKLTLDAASAPLGLAVGGRETPIVSAQTLLHANASLALFDRALVDVNLPIALVQHGRPADATTGALGSPGAAKVGDLRLGGRIRVLGDETDPVQLGTGIDVWVPTGPAGSFVGEDHARVAGYLAAGGLLHPGVDLRWDIAAGPSVRASQNGSGLRWGLGVALVPFHEALQVGAELLAVTPFQSSALQLTTADRVTTPRKTNLELLLGVRARAGSLVVGASGGPGLVGGIGTPDLRMTASVAYEPGREKPSATTLDTDADGIVDTRDACPYAFGVAARSGCPLLDDDEDGVPNDEDACPNAYGPSNPTRRGCPKDPPAP